MSLPAGRSPCKPWSGSEQSVGQAVEKLGLGEARVAWVADGQPVVDMWTASIPSPYGALAQRRDQQQDYYC